MFDKINQDLVIVYDNHLEEENSNAQQTIVYSHTSIHLFYSIIENQTGT